MHNSLYIPVIHLKSVYILLNPFIYTFKSLKLPLNLLKSLYIPLTPFNSIYIPLSSLNPFNPLNMFIPLNSLIPQSLNILQSDQCAQISHEFRVVVKCLSVCLRNFSLLAAYAAKNSNENQIAIR